jgi:hypothetical protein
VAGEAQPAMGYRGGQLAGHADFIRATGLDEGARTAIADAFQYHPWTPEQITRGDVVRVALIHAVETIVQAVPPGPDRSAAIRKIREARMDANSAITHGGKY